MKFSARYLVKKGPADPFRGDWYVLTRECSTRDEAIEIAGTLTLASFKELKEGWEAHGYEWSVFKVDPEKKIWEGYKFIQEMRARPEALPDFNLGFMEEV